MKNKKMLKKLQKELERDPFMRFAKQKNPTMYKSELNKLFNREKKHLRQKKIGQKEAEKQMNFIEAQSQFSHINDPWLRKHLAYKLLQKNKKQSPKNNKFYL
jgi:hypothetical protein